MQSKRNFNEDEDYKKSLQTEILNKKYMQWTVELVTLQSLEMEYKKN
jgi:hypothetical protein